METSEDRFADMTRELFRDIDEYFALAEDSAEPGKKEEK